MLLELKNKISKSKINSNPFPYMFIKNIFDKKFVDELNAFLPSFEYLTGKEIMYQSESKSKKTILPSSAIYKKLDKNKLFKNVNNSFKKLQPTIIKKFKKYIKIHINKEYHNSKLKYHSSFSIMKKGYKKSSHLDRRDHLIHMIFYPESDASKGGEICLNKVKNKSNRVNDIFPSKNSWKIYKKYKVSNNSLLIILNVPWAYHSVSKYYGKKDRKYFYMVYDFPIKKSGSRTENRKKGFNKNDFWKQKVIVKSNKRKKIFLTE